MSESHVQNESTEQFFVWNSCGYVHNLILSQLTNLLDRGIKSAEVGSHHKKCFGLLELKKKKNCLWIGKMTHTDVYEGKSRYDLSLVLCFFPLWAFFFFFFLRKWTFCRGNLRRWSLETPFLAKSAHKGRDDWAVSCLVSHPVVSTGALMYLSPEQWTALQPDVKREDFPHKQHNYSPHSHAHTSGVCGPAG